MKWLAIAMCVPSVAMANVPRTMHWVRGETIHLANQGGAIHRDDDARVEMTLVDDTKIAITDRGSKKEHNLYETYSTDDVTTWTNVWTGTYQVSGDEMRIALSLQRRTCSKTRSSGDAAGKPGPCDPIDKTIKLRCGIHETNLVTAPGKPPDVEMLWSCYTDDRLGDTPLPWVFGGKPACIEASPGPAETTYRRC